MPKIFIPSQFRDLTGEMADLELPGSNLRQVVAALEERFPGIQTRICSGDAIAPGLAVWIDGAITSKGLLAAVKPDSQIHFLPAFGGG
jgi:molybdopterin synthase sulfur carrier subunit